MQDQEENGYMTFVILSYHLCSPLYYIHKHDILHYH